MLMSSNWVILNVGGHRMETSLSTVTKYSDSVLAKKFLDDVPTVEKVYNLDCDPTAFNIILTWLRY